MTGGTAVPDVKAEVRAFYDSVGWQEIGDGLYQNARYEDLRPVSREYIRRCHERVARHIPRTGRLLLDAGSGPIQYPEYLEYSRGYDRRVCLDISLLALREARKRIGAHGLFVLGDLAALPFRSAVFSGVVSLHAVHHVPMEEQATALAELDRVAETAGSAVVVYSWGGHSRLMAFFRPAIAAANGLRRQYARLRGRASSAARPSGVLGASGSHSFKHDYAWMKAALARIGGGDILVWRSVSTEFLRSLIFRRALGRSLLRLVYALEELAPHWFGRHGMYPMVVLRHGNRDHPRGNGYEMA